MIKTPLNLAMLGDPAAEQFCEILGLADTFAPLTDDGCGPPSPSFSYFAFDTTTYELSDALASGRVAVINVPDSAGVYRQVPTTKVAYVGARHADGKQYADNGSGVLLDPQPYALSAPAATNSHLWGRDFTQWIATGANVATKDQIGIDGVANACSMISKNAGVNAYYSLYFASASSAGEIVSFAAFIKKTGTGAIFCIQLATVGVNGLIEIKVSDGTWAYYPGQQSVISSVTVVDDGLWWRIVGTYTNASAQANMKFNIYPAITGVLGTAVDISASGNQIIDAFQVYHNTPHAIALTLPPIFTTTAAVPRDKDVIAASLANLNQPSNSGYIEVNVATGSTPAILGAFLSFDGTSYKLFDGTTTVSVAGTVGAHKLGWYAGPSGMNLCVDGTWGTEAAYDATLAAALGIFTDSAYPQQCRNFRLYASASQEAIDLEMAA